MRIKKVVYRYKQEVDDFECFLDELVESVRSDVKIKGRVSVCNYNDHVYLMFTRKDDWVKSPDIIHRVGHMIFASECV